ncbi:MAG: hypothetical protein R3182_08535, partial [Draconibacterium sp.]|nr:hypothetical protein [Draconibacterium sp.]
SGRSIPKAFRNQEKNKLRRDAYGTSPHKPTLARLPDGKGRHFFQANALFDPAKSQLSRLFESPKAGDI